jgi:hypothetical protein
VRTNLRALLAEGINPLNFFDRDYKKVCWHSSCNKGKGHICRNQGMQRDTAVAIKAWQGTQ